MGEQLLLNKALISNKKAATETGSVAVFGVGVGQSNFLVV